MTGFGVGSSAERGAEVLVEIRAVNHRSLDLKLRGRDLSAEAEVEIARMVRTVVHRGAVQVSVAVRHAGAAGEDTPVDRLLAAHAVVREATARLGLRDEGLQAAALLLHVPGFAGAGPKPVEWAEARPAVESALGALHLMRAREGQALATDIVTRAERVARIVDALVDRSEGLPRLAARRLHDRVRALTAGSQAPSDVDAASAPLPGLDPGRLAQEVALLADRLDVSEELTRLRVHLQALRDLCGASEQAGPRGRQIEFLLQEIGRELHTTGSKAQDVEVTNLVIEARAEVEKMREQAQNVE